MRNLLSLALATLVSLPGVFGLGSAMEGLDTAMQIQREQMDRVRAMMGARVEAMNNQRRAPKPPPSTITFRNPKAKDFFVDGTKIPDVNFDAGPSWAGLMPISGARNETRKLFFWFWPTNNPAHTKDLVFWTNGAGLRVYASDLTLTHITQVVLVALRLKASCKKMALFPGHGVKQNPLRKPLPSLIRNKSLIVLGTETHFPGQIWPMSSGLSSPLEYV